MYRIDARELPSTQGFDQRARAMLEEGLGVDRCQRESLPDIEIAIAIVKRGVEGIGVTQAKRIVGLGEGGAEFVKFVRERVIGHQAQPRLEQVGRLELNIRSLIEGTAVRASVIRVGVLAVEPGQSVVAGNGIDIRIAEQRIAAAEAVVVLDVVEVNTMSGHILDRNDGIPCQFVFKSEAPELSLRRPDVLVDVTYAGGRQGNGARTACQRPGIGVRDLGVVDDDYRVAGRVLNHVEGYVAEVALVRDSEAAADGVAPVAEEVIGEAYARRYRAVLRIPQFVNGAVRHGEDISGAFLLREGCTWTEVEIRVQTLVVVVLNAVVLVTHAIVRGELRRELK